MTQHQKTVTLQLKDGASATAAVTGNNAAWSCPCGRSLPLIGRSDPSEAGLVECPECQRSYRIMPEAGPHTRAVQVIEQ